jgi:predicted dehydrogenase
MVRIGIAGAGNIGKHYITQFPATPDIDISAIYDVQADVLQDFSTIATYSNFDEFLMACDALILCTPKESHFMLAAEAMRKGKHILMVHPVSLNLKESAELLSLSKESNVRCMIGGTERFNAAWTSIQNGIHNPMFLEGHRLAVYNPDISRNSVILDLMIQDIDLVLRIVKSEIKRISASGMAVLSESIDIANARLEFSNGCIANLTASRVSLKDMNKLRIFQKNGYYSVDLLHKKADFISIQSTPSREDSQIIPITTELNEQKFIEIQTQTNTNFSSTKSEIQHFLECVHEHKTPVVSIQDTYLNLDIAHRIIRKIHYSEEK